MKSKKIILLFWGLTLVSLLIISCSDVDTIVKKEVTKNFEISKNTLNLRLKSTYINGINVEDKKLWCRVFADVNGDGKADMIWRLGTYIYVSISDGTKFQLSSPWTYWSPQGDFKLADVNGDGKADIIGRTANEIHVALSTGSNFIPSTSWTYWDSTADYNLADVDGDGKADLIGRMPNSSYIHVAISNGSSFLPPVSWTYWDSSAEYKLADVNGDGKADLVGRLINSNDLHVALSTGSGFYTSSKWTYWDSSAEYKLADVNGDGKADLVGRLPNSNDLHVALSAGGEFYTSSKWTYWNQNSEFELLDANGDNKADIVGRLLDDFEVGLSTGVNFVSSSKWSTNTFSTLNFIANINGNLLRHHVESICAYHPRLPRAYDFTTELDSENINTVSQYIENQFHLMGYTTERESVYVNNIYCGDNVIAKKSGEVFPNSYIEFTCHYDGGFGGSPAAKDNASGVASVLEIARVLATYKNRNSMRFIAFTAEEYGVPGGGSKTHVDKIIVNGDKILADLNIDTSGTGNADSNGNLIYIDDNNRTQFLNKDSRWKLEPQKEDYLTLWYRDVASYEITQLFNNAVKAYSIPLHKIEPIFNPQFMYEDSYIQPIQSDEIAYYLKQNVATTSLGDWSNSWYHSTIDKPLNVNYNNVLWIAQANLAVGITLDN